MVLPDKSSKGTINTNLVSLADIMPTFCDYAKISPNINFAGKSLRKALTSHGNEFREYVVTELADNLKDRSRKGRMVRTERFKYTIYSSGKRNEQLFDLISDPGETRNLAYEEAYKEIVNKHRQLLKEWMKERNDNFKMFFYE